MSRDLDPITIDIDTDYDQDEATAITIAPRPSPLTPAWLTNTEPDPSTPFGALYAETYGHHQRQTWQGFWDEAVERWLHSGRRRSENTRRAYRHSILQFRAWLRDRHALYHLWQINDRIAQDWLTYMRDECAYKPATIGNRIAAVSSLYTYCANTRTILGGREISLLIDAYGNTRGNPFQGATIERPKVEQYSGVTGVPTEAFAWIIADLRNRKPSAGNLRNLAILLMFGLNGWRNQEVLSMKWGKINPNHQHKGEWTYRWTGKARDGAEEKRSLPAANYDAIVAYLRADGRWNPGADGHIQDDDYIWRPVRTHGAANFANTGALATNRHITQSTINEILTSLLRRYYLHTARAAGLDRAAASHYANEQAAKYSIHSLRHMFAWTLHKASGNNIKMVQEKLGHHDVSTTMRYLEHLEEPVDDHSGLIARQLGLAI